MFLRCSLNRTSGGQGLAKNAKIELLLPNMEAKKRASPFRHKRKEMLAKPKIKPKLQFCSRKLNKILIFLNVENKIETYVSKN